MLTLSREVDECKPLARGVVLSTEKEEAVSRARAALRAKEVAQAELQHLMSQRHQQAGVVDGFGREVDRLEGMLADREATASAASEEHGVTSKEKARVAARAADAAAQVKKAHDAQTRAKAAQHKLEQKIDAARSAAGPSR